MADITFTEVVRLAEQLNPEEQDALIAHLHQLARQRQLTIEEKKALFQSMIIDVGEIRSSYSDHREDWYNDDDR